MIPKSFPWICMIFLLLCELTRSTINMANRVSRRGKRKTAISRHVSGDHCISLLQHLSTHMHFITNVYERFLKANSTVPRQRVPLKGKGIRFHREGTVSQCAINFAIQLMLIFSANFNTICWQSRETALAR